MFIIFPIYLPPTQLLVLYIQHISSGSVLDLSDYSWLLKYVHKVYYVAY